MEYIVEAACVCNRGKVRKNNEDNFLFDSRFLPEENYGLDAPIIMKKDLEDDVCFAVFDGMGGENYGEVAANTAAACMYRQTSGKKQFFVPDMEFVTEMVSDMNAAVVTKAQSLLTEHMGTTLAALYFHRGYAYICNLGDSRGYRLQNGIMQQLTIDHLEQRGGYAAKKRPLSQHLGIPSDVLQITPHIAKGKLEQGDQFLLCSDGLTDMLSDAEIRTIWVNAADPLTCVNDLMNSALNNGGRDNITVIVCSVR